MLNYQRVPFFVGWYLFSVSTLSILMVQDPAAWHWWILWSLDLDPWCSHLLIFPRSQGMAKPLSIYYFGDDLSSGRMRFSMFQIDWTLLCPPFCPQPATSRAWSHSFIQLFPSFRFTDASRASRVARASPAASPASPAASPMASPAASPHS